MELVSWPPGFLDWHDLSANFDHARRFNPVEITTINKALDGTRSRFCWPPPPVFYLAKARVGGSALPRALDSGNATLHQFTRCLFLASVIPTHRDGQPDTSSTLVQRNRTPSATCPGTPLAEHFQRSPVRLRALWWGRPAVAGADARIRMRERSRPEIDCCPSWITPPAVGARCRCALGPFR